jgi:hypothetical protein
LDRAGIPRQPIPDAAFTINNAPIAALGNILNTSAEQPADKARSNIAKAGMEIIKVYPNPFNDRFNIDFYNTAASNDISIGVYDVKGRLVYTYHAGNVAEGNRTLKINLNNSLLPDGVYIATLNVNGIRLKPFNW